MDIRQYLEARRKQVDAALDNFLPDEKGTLAEHIKAMRYSLFAGGKRVRPILCLAAAEAVQDYEDSLPKALHRYRMRPGMHSHLFPDPR